MDKENVKHLYTMENYLTIKRKKILLYATAGIHLKDFMLCKLRHLHKGKYCMAPLTGNI
jgi:hypothetical protein